MDEDEFVGVDTDNHASHRVGERLRQAREARGQTLDGLAAATRIPKRHLEAIEAGRFESLPSRAYAIGFSRTYARTMGLDEAEVLDAVRAELAEQQETRPPPPAKFEPGDPARVPGRGLAWFAALAVVLLLAGLYAFYSSYLRPGLGPAPLTEDRPQVAARTAPAARPAAKAPAGGPVVFTAEMDDTWVKFYDASGTRLFEAQMAKGDTFTIPAGAEGPQVWTGRPYALAITVGGKPVPKLSDEDEIIRDVPVSAEALLARASAPAVPTAPAGAPAAPR